MVIDSFATRLSSRGTLAKRLCVGIDPHPELLSSWGLPDTAQGIGQFSRVLLDHVSAVGVGIVKPQVAFFERHGVAGLQVLHEVIGAARESGLLVIADAKRGDVGSTVAAYADAWLRPGSDFSSDAVTAVAFQGVGSLQPLFDLALEHSRGVFVLANTSNPDGWALQGATGTDGVTVSQHITNDLADIQAHSGQLGWLGAVIGATLTPRDRSVDVSEGFPLWILAPGFGHQGARLADVGSIFPGVLDKVIPTVSRSVVTAGPNQVHAELARHLEEVALSEL